VSLREEGSLESTFSKPRPGKLSFVIMKQSEIGDERLPSTMRIVLILTHFFYLHLLRQQTAGNSAHSLAVYSALGLDTCGLIIFRRGHWCSRYNAGTRRARFLPAFPQTEMPSSTNQGEPTMRVC